MRALILIGGEGTRLRPLTMNTLKCLSPIANRPFLEYQFNLLRQNGVKDIILSICYLPQVVKRHLGSGKRYGVRLKYVAEKHPLGTAGAVKNAERMLDKETIVMNGDILTDVDIKKLIHVHRKNRSAATLTLHQVDDPTSYGLVETDAKGHILKFLEKPSFEEAKRSSWINAGLYIFDKKVLELIPEGKNFSLERGVFPRILKEGWKFMAYKDAFYWIDIGRIEKYVHANYDVLEERFHLHPAYKKKLRPGVKVGSRVKIARGASLNGPVLAGDGCRIGKAMLHPLTILGSNVTVGDGSMVERSIIWEGTHIGANSVLRECLIGRNCRIEANSILHGAVIGDNSVVTRFSKIGER